MPNGDKTLEDVYVPGSLVQWCAPPGVPSHLALIYGVVVAWHDTHYSVPSPVLEDARKCLVLISWGGESHEALLGRKDLNSWRVVGTPGQFWSELCGDE